MGKKNGRNDAADLSRLNPLDSKDKRSHQTLTP